MIRSNKSAFVNNFDSVTVYFSITVILTTIQRNTGIFVGDILSRNVNWINIEEIEAMKWVNKC